MSKQKIITIGAVAAGMGFASKLRRAKNDNFDHVLYEKRSYATLGACGIPFVIGGKAPNGEKDLISLSVDDIKKSGINIKAEHEILSINYKAKEVEVKNLKTGDIFKDNYDQLFIASGARPFVPNPDWLKYENVSTATSYEDVLKIKKLSEKKDIENITIIGSGFIGIELAENLLEKNKKIRIIEMQDLPVKAQFDQEFGETLKDKMTESGVILNFEERVTDIIENGDKVVEVITDKGKYKTDALIIAIGFRPNTEFAGNEIKKHPNGSIVVNRMGQTSIENVWAAGDCVSVYNPILKQDQYIPLATLSRKLASVIFENMIEDKKYQFPGGIGTSGFRFGEVELFRTGLSKADLEKNGIEYKAININSNDCAYYSGNAKPMQIKIFANANQELIGAQAYGYNKSAAMRIGVLAMAITKKVKLKELENFDFFYTPPFSSATDIIHIAARQLLKKY